MTFWRVSRHRDLRGLGGLWAAGRWHFAGRPIIYLAESPAAALLEVCVHTSANNLPPAFTLLRIEGPNLKAKSINLADLPENWRTRLDLTRGLGTSWLEQNDTVVLRVPSAIVPATMNCLFNPAHRQAADFRIVSAIPCPFDPRLKL